MVTSIIVDGIIIIIMNKMDDTIIIIIIIDIVQHAQYDDVALQYNVCVYHVMVYYSMLQGDPRGCGSPG